MLKRLMLLFVIPFALLSGFKAGAAEVEATYTVIDLGEIAEKSSAAMATNGWSTILGMNPDGTTQPYLVSPAGVRTKFGNGTLVPEGIANTREVVGWNRTTNKGFRYTFKDGVKTVGLNGYTASPATSISPNGMFIGGYAKSDSTPNIPWRYLNVGTVPSVQKLPDTGCSIYGVNSIGEYCGRNNEGAFVRDEYGLVVMATGPYAIARAINGKGTVVGNTGDYTIAFSWTRLGDGTASMKTLKSLYGGYLQVFAVNDAGYAVGNDSGHACIIDPTWQKVTDLSEQMRNSGWRLYNAKGISNDGKILAFGASSATAPVHALLLIPGS